MDEALRGLEEVAVWLVWREIYVELERLARLDLLHWGSDLERVLHKLAACSVHNLQQSPVKSYWEPKFVLDRNLFRFRCPSAMCVLKVYWVDTKLHVSFGRSERLEHLFVQSNLRWVVNWDFIRVVDVLGWVDRSQSVSYFFGDCLCMCSHSYLVSEHVNVFLH